MFYDTSIRIWLSNVNCCKLVACNCNCRPIHLALKMREWKMREQIGGVENAGVDKEWKAVRIKYSQVLEN